MSRESSDELAAICREYRGRVVSYAAKLIGRGEAEDIAQEVFVKVSRSLDTLLDRSRLAPWIFAITLNTVRDAARRSALSASRAGTPLTPSEGEPADSPAGIPDVGARSPEELAIRKEMVACYLGYLEALPHSYYEVYVLSEFEDLSNPEIARRLSLPVSTVKIRLHRARARLHGELRRNCRCYWNERGELMAEPVSPPSNSPPVPSRAAHTRSP